MTNFEKGYINFMKLAGLTDEASSVARRAIGSGATIPTVAAVGLGSMGLHKRLQEDEDAYQMPDNLPEQWGMDPKAQLMLLALNANQ